MHWLHLILTILFFPWIIIWIFCAVSNSQHNAKEDRKVWQQQAAQQSAPTPVPPPAPFNNSDLTPRPQDRRDLVHPDSYTKNIDGNNNYKG
jgi:hypothetical protein